MHVKKYRPVPVLPLLSKILERMMYSRILTFINKHDILYRYQFGFRQHYSTNLALITLIDKITESLQKGECVLGVFLDFSGPVEFHKALSWDLFYFCYTLMIFAMYLTFFFPFYLQMIPIYF